MNHVILKTDEYRKIKVKSNKIYVRGLSFDNLERLLSGTGG